MGTVPQYLQPEEAAFRTGLPFPQFVRIEGTNLPVTGLAFDGATTNEYAFWKFSPFNYGSGSLTVDVLWYVTAGTSGSVDWAAAVAAITPGDSEDVQSAQFGSSPLVSTSHLGTTARRLHKTTITVTSGDLDGMAAGDECWLRLVRNQATDSITADAILTSVRLSYSDT